MEEPLLAEPHWQHNKLQPDPVGEEQALAELLEQEERELEALVALMEAESDQENVAMSSHFGSDIDDYDEIFSEYLSSQAVNGSSFSSQFMGDAMDTSGG